MPSISKFYLNNQGAYDAWLGGIYFDPKDPDKKQHGPVWDPQGHRISWGSGGTFDIGNCSLPSGVRVWVALYVYSGWDCYGLSSDGGGLIYIPGDSHTANYTSWGTTLKNSVLFDKITIEEK